MKRWQLQKPGQNRARWKFERQEEMKAGHIRSFRSKTLGFFPTMNSKFFRPFGSVAFDFEISQSDAECCCVIDRCRASCEVAVRSFEWVVVELHTVYIYIYNYIYIIISFSYSFWVHLALRSLNLIRCSLSLDSVGHLVPSFGVAIAQELAELQAPLTPCAAVQQSEIDCWIASQVLGVDGDMESEEPSVAVIAGTEYISIDISRTSLHASCQS